MKTEPLSTTSPIGQINTNSEGQHGLWQFDPINLPKPIKAIRNSFGALTSARQITDTVARLIDIDEAKRRPAQIALDRAFESAESLFIRNLSKAGDSGPGLDEFVFTADPQAADGIFKQLSSDLMTTLGEEKAHALLNSINFHQYFSGMCLLDARISFKDIPEDPSNPGSALQTHVDYVFRDPKTSGIVLSSGGFFEGLPERFGSKAFARDAEASKIPATETP